MVSPVKSLLLISLFGLMAAGPSGNPEYALGLPPLPPAAPEAVVRLGSKVFFDNTLSRDSHVACYSCHSPATAFADNQSTGRGVDFKLGTRNGPSLMNVTFLNTFMWDGRIGTLEEAVLAPFTNVREMGMKNLDEVLARLKKDPAYQQSFKQAFPDDAQPIQSSNLAKALTAFLSTLNFGNSAFDRYEYGKHQTALSAAQKRGLSIFRNQGRCTACHTINKEHALFTDEKFHVSGSTLSTSLAFTDIPLLKSKLDMAAKMPLGDAILTHPEVAEMGRFMVTRDPLDTARFRTPSLRNVAVTFPYFHDGSTSSLKLAVLQEANTHENDLAPEDIDDLVAFLHSLTSEVVP
ncbi:cytochrome-c peroxidase [Deinococcus cellulosilyticus]|uniref:Cytochrome c551 peroxidase n=1 Tax=Deinococcus cellulosilyticus (strain DSM 18568 / NBRC 106333 / KACC 11606 / 5516J-15) TaxID=1223518 RepID=A0A511N9W4_DEIC1|nr:cytochrome c peroxidase [Deinococcus cellulosilyticus]GEM49357.1 cytochrome c551 peroxidase [Deinococcus cellulosilyticus NBRC 106333 = KACC 11606]